MNKGLHISRPFYVVKTACLLRMSTSRHNGKNIGSLFLLYVCKKQPIIFVFNFEKKMLI